MGAHAHAATAGQAAARPDPADAMFRQGVAEYQAGRVDRAITLLRDAARHAPSNPTVHAVLGAAHASADQPERAVTSFERALAIDAQYAEAWGGLGAALAVLGRHEDAARALQRATTVKPDLVDAHKNLANVLLELGRYQEALAAYDRALEIRPDFVEARFNRANLLLMLGRFRDGWREYEWRKRMPRNAPRAVPLPNWRGEPLGARALHVIGEQAAGDAVMFGTCLPELKGVDGPVWLHCEQRLVDLLARSLPWARVTNALPTETANACTVALGSLPGLFRNEENDFARSRPYLKADPAATARWRARFDALGAGLKVGFSWRGGKSHVQRRQRTMDLASWRPVLETAGARFIDLQYGEHDDERAVVKERHGLTPFRPAEVEATSDLDGFAAQVAALDLVISIDNTTVHFAGALGVPVWTLIPRAPSWRWFLERDDSPWYPTMRLIRQGDDEQWDSVLVRTAGALSDHLASRPEGRG